LQQKIASHCHEIGSEKYVTQTELSTATLVPKSHPDVEPMKCYWEHLKEHIENLVTTLETYNFHSFFSLTNSNHNNNNNNKMAGAFAISF